MSPTALVNRVLSPLRSLTNGNLAAVTYLCLALGGAEIVLDVIGRPVDLVIRDSFRAALALLLVLLGASHAAKATGVNNGDETPPPPTAGGPKPTNPA